MTEPTTAEHSPATTAAQHAHPTEWVYIKVAIFLAVVTLIEVGLYYRTLGAANNAVLLVLSAIKFAFVVLYFMHLKFDSRILRRLFFTGLVLAVGVYLIVLLASGVFIG